MTEDVAPCFGQVWGAQFVSASSAMPYRPSGRDRMMLLRETAKSGMWLAVHLAGPNKGVVEEIWTRFSFHERMRYIEMADDETQAAYAAEGAKA